MKKIFSTIILLSLTVVLSGCNKQVQTTTSNTATQQIQPETSQSNYYSNKELGINFIYYKSDDFWDGKIKTQNNKIIYEDSSDGFSQYIELFTKKDSQTIEEAILEIVKNKDKDPKNCKVINKGEYWAVHKYSAYILDLANPKISYSKQELEEIRLADIEAKKDNGPFNGEWKKEEIYNKRLVENCSDYAEPLGIGTSSSQPSTFIYNNKTKFVFLPASPDVVFYQADSIELID